MMRFPFRFAGCMVPATGLWESVKKIQDGWLICMNGCVNGCGKEGENTVLQHLKSIPPSHEVDSKYYSYRD